MDKSRRVKITKRELHICSLPHKNANDYKVLKTHSLCTIGYLSQVVKTSTLFKNLMSVCSKILLQINAKLGGAT